MRSITLITGSSFVARIQHASKSEPCHPQQSDDINSHIEFRGGSTSQGSVPKDLLPNGIKDGSYRETAKGVGVPALFDHVPDPIRKFRVLGSVRPVTANEPVYRRNLMHGWERGVSCENLRIGTVQ